MSTLVNDAETHIYDFITSTNNMEMKRCARCQRTLSRDAFNKSKNRYDGLNVYCRECQTKKGRKYYQENRERILAQIHANKKERSEKKRAYYRNLRTKVLKHISSNDLIECKICGFKDYRALQIDHLIKIGKKEQDRFGNQLKYYRHILSLTKEEVKKDYQILCANCNWIKRQANREMNQHSRRSQ